MPTSYKIGQAPWETQQAPQGQSLGQFALSAARGAVNFIDNNPISKSITSLAALPVQGLAKALGQPDPYAGGIGAGSSLFEPVHVTSSDQPLGKWAEAEAGNALTAGSLFVPVGRVAGAAAPYIAPVLGRFAPAAARIGVQTALGSGQGAAASMQQGQSMGDIQSAAKTGAMWGGGLASAGEFGSALLNNMAAKSAAGRLTEHTQSGGAAKTLTNAFNNNSTKTTNPIQTLEQNGLIQHLKVDGSKINVEGLTNPQGSGAIDGLIEAHQNSATPLVESMQQNIKTDDFKNAVIDAVKQNPQIRDSGGVSRALADVERRFEDYKASFGDTLPAKVVNGIRVAMNRVWNPDERDVAGTVGDAARTWLYSQAGEGTALQSLMQNEAELIRARNFVDKLSGTAVRGGMLKKWFADMAGGAIGMSVGGAAGSLLGPFGMAGGMGVGGVVGGATTNAAINHMNANYFSPLLSGPAQAARNFIQSAGVQGGKTLLKTGFINSVSPPSPVQSYPVGQAPWEQ